MLKYKLHDARDPMIMVGSISINCAMSGILLFDLYYVKNLFRYIFIDICFHVF